MREVLFRVSWLLSRRAIALPWVVLALAGIALTFGPLLGMPGYELSVGLCLLITFIGPFVATASARAGAGAIHTPLVLFAAVLPALITSTLKTWLGSPCDPFTAVGFVPVLIIPSVLLVAALGHAIARLSRRRWLTLALWTLAILISAASTVLPLITGPQVFAFNHLGGYMPGPLYDEELSITSSLLWFRLATIALAIGLSSLVAGRRLIAAIALVTFGTIEFQGTQLGFRATDRSVAEALGGIVETNELTLHFPRGVPAEDVTRMVGDLEFRLHQLVEFFGARPEGKVTVWWYRSTEEKQRLVGAANTQFAKPWRREVHVNSLGFPHPVIKHELVHALAAPWGAAPFGVAASVGGFLPHVGVVEGFAVAADNPIDDLTLHEWCAAMKKKDLLPDVAQLMTPQGFYGTAHTRAYTTAGSFLRWLAEVHGKDKLRALYRHGDFEEAFGQPLATLAASYTMFLDTVRLEPENVNQAFGRFRRGSLFDRPCAREVARLSADAGALINADPQRAMRILSRCRTLQPEEPSHALAQAQLLRRLGANDDARALLESELTRLQNDPTSWSDAALVRADLALEEGQLDVARALWTRLIALQISPAVDRTAQIRSRGVELTSPQSRAAVQRHFQLGGEDTKLLALREAAEADPQAMPVQYLLGRRLQQAGEAREALPVLEAVIATPELPTSIARESTRLAIEAAFGARDCETIARLGAASFGPAFQARAADWLERCRFGTSPAKP